jgi:heme-degrading monooxygenase HmoA
MSLADPDEEPSAPPPPVATPPPPYLAVMFVARLRPVDLGEYRARSDALMAKARQLPGFLGEDALRLEDNRLISISYWKDEESLRGWKFDSEHVETKRMGRESWYEYYELRIARVEQASSFRASDAEV